ncbi:MAG: OsmC family protein [Chloroflexi bacterium]|nr:OsmC family protein [Chloroflexota bacterium]
MSTQVVIETNAPEAATIATNAVPVPARISLPPAATVQAIQAALRAAGEDGRVQFVAETRLVKGYETAANIRGFQQVIDEPPSLGGTNQGPNPVEIVLAALGACQEIVYATYATLLNIQIDRLDIKVVGHLDPRGFYGVADVPAGFERVEFEVNLSSPSPADQVRQLVQIVNQHCPVLDILQRPLPVQGRVEHNGQSLN